MSTLAALIGECILSNHITVLSRDWVLSEQNIEAVALSRIEPDRQSDWALAPAYWRGFLSLLGASHPTRPAPDVDCFATRRYRLCHSYMSFYRQGTWAVWVALEMHRWTPDWFTGQTRLFADRGWVLSVLRQHQVRAYLLAPCWTTRPWFSFFQAGGGDAKGWGGGGVCSMQKTSLRRARAVMHPWKEHPG